jgi:predicted extracellular nuclease
LQPARSRAERVGGVLAAAGLLTAGVAVGAAAPAAAAPSTGVVINEVYGGGGNSGGAFSHDFIELANRGTSAQDLSSWSVQYISASPGATTTWQVTPLSGTFQAGKSYLVAEAMGANTPPQPDLPPAQATGSIAMAATSGTVALVNSTAALTCKTAADCAADGSIVDLVGWGTAVIHEGAADAPGTTNATSTNRSAAVDTDDNGADFTTAAPTPTGDPVGGGGGTPGPLRIHDIQGTSWISPHAGDSVTDVPGIVTAVRSSGSSKGYWMQDPDPDSDPATSEGIFVFTGSVPTVHVGDSVLVSGKVSDFYPLGSGETVSTTSNLSTTEIGTATTTVLSTGNVLPAPVMLDPNTVPNVYAPDLGGGNIEDIPITPSRSALDFYESIEGMRAEVQGAHVVGPSNSFGEQYVTTKPDQNATYRGGTELQAEDAIPSGRLEVVPIDGGNPGLNVGDVLDGATVGPIEWSQFGGYSLVATTMGAVKPGGLQPVVATPGPRGKLSIATYNVENLAPSDPDSKFAALADGIVTNLAAPDIVAVEEVQDNTGATDDGTVAANLTLTELTAAITAAGGPSYQWREIDPVDDKDGGEPGGNIRVVFLFNPARVSFVDSGSPSVDRSTTATQVVKSHGQPALTLSPGRIDPTNPVWTDSRKPLVGEFRFGGRNVFVVANHFDSKGGDQNADGRFQFPERSSEIQRAGQAAAVHDFVSSILAIDKSADVVVVGDLNDYQFSPALRVLTTGSAAGAGTPILTDLITTLPLDQRYTYVFDGISQVLDHILVAPKVRGVTYQVVHINAEFADQTSDHDPQVVDITP